MYEQATRLLGLEGLVVTAVEERGEELELEVELLARAGCCRACGRRVAKRLDASRYPPSA